MIFPLLLLFLTAQIPCAPREFSDSCGCKQGQATACEALRQTDPQLADALERAATQTLKVQEEAGEAEAAETVTQEAIDADEPPQCKGQLHHIISRTIAKALKTHAKLKGLYTARDPRFVARAKDEDSHCGYQQWHRDVDDEVVRWLSRTENATPQKFEAFLREIYSRAAMRARFPDGF